MIQRTKWTERKFTFDFPEGWLSNILERLRGTVPRLIHMTSDLDNDQLEFRPDGKWNIKEHIGHLADLEELHDGRIDDFMARREVLRAADMSNAKTYKADHEAKSLANLLEEFKLKRTQYIARIEMLDEQTQTFRALHPRLQTLVRPVDIAYFTAEHDDHHLADIHSVINQFTQ